MVDFRDARRRYAIGGVDGTDHVVEVVGHLHLPEEELAAADHASLDEDVLYAAAYLHDIAAFAPWEDTKVDHSDVGAKVIDSISRSNGSRTGSISGEWNACETASR